MPQMCERTTAAMRAYAHGHRLGQGRALAFTAAVPHTVAAGAYLLRVLEAAMALDARKCCLHDGDNGPNAQA